LQLGHRSGCVCSPSSATSKWWWHWLHANRMGLAYSDPCDLSTRGSATRGDGGPVALAPVPVRAVARRHRRVSRCVHCHRASDEASAEASAAAFRMAR
jgi:hypothetical protein